MMIAPALLVGFAKGILLLVGNGEAGQRVKHAAAQYCQRH